jgi:uncharacterized protein GlcG (DUF336 family)
MIGRSEPFVGLRGTGSATWPAAVASAREASNSGRIMIFAGGIPLKRAGKVVGGIGVSGGSGEQDQTVAEAGAAAFS